MADDTAVTSPPGAPGRRAGLAVLPWQLVLGVPYVALLVSVAAASLRAVLVTLLACMLVDSWVRDTWPASAHTLRTLQLGSGVRWFVRALLLCVAVAQEGEATASDALVGALVLGTALIALARGAWALFVRRGTYRLRRRVAWRGLPVGGRFEGPRPVPPAGFLGRPVTDDQEVLRVEVLLLVGVALSVGLGTGVPAWVGLVAAVVTALAVALSALRFERASARAPGTADLMPALVEGLTDLAPEVVVYFSSPPSGTYALRVWLDIIRRFTNRTVIVLREAHHLDALDLDGIPVLVLPQAADVEAAQVPSMRVALYPTNVVKNNHMVRLPGIQHAFIGHGDSDKAGSYSPVTRVYDEIWVAGEAGRDRYVAAAEGVRPEQVRTVGRPQLARVVRRPVRSVLADDQDGLPTVLYAPTWEGFYDESDYCSVAVPGLAAVRAMVRSGRFRVLFKPHPATGARREDVVAALAEIEQLVSSAPHARVPDGPESLYDAMNDADVLLSDVSSVLSDWLASSRPYVVTNPKDLDADDLRGLFPTTRGGHLLSPDDDVLTVLDEALGSDPLASARQELSVYLLGAPRPDPLQDFVDEVAAFVDRSAAAAAARSPEGVR